MHFFVKELLIPIIQNQGKYHWQPFLQAYEGALQVIQDLKGKNYLKTIDTQDLQSKNLLHKPRFLYVASKLSRYVVVKAAKAPLLVALVCLQWLRWVRSYHASCLGDSYKVVTRPLTGQEAGTSVLGGIV